MFADRSFFASRFLFLAGMSRLGKLFNVFKDVKISGILMCFMKTIRTIISYSIMAGTQELIWGFFT